MSTLSELSGLAALIASMVAIYIALRKTPYEIRGLDTNNDKTLLEIANLASERALKLEERLASSENKQTEQAQELATVKESAAKEIRELREAYIEEIASIRKMYESENIRLRNENEDLRDWAERLVNQVKQAGLDPVKLRNRALLGKTVR